VSLRKGTCQALLPAPSPALAIAYLALLNRQAFSANSHAHRSVMTHSEIVSPCIARDARAICREQGIIGIGDRRDRTPTEQELALLTKYSGP
jgi:hypothetical protein